MDTHKALILCIYELLLGALLIVFGGIAGAGVGGILVGHGIFLSSVHVKSTRK